MSSGGKSGGSSTDLNYYGTIAGALGWGPCDWLLAVIHNGNYIFQGTLAITDDVTDLTGSLLDPTVIGPGGWLKLYRGTETQPASTIITNNPTDKGTVKIEGKNLFFGQNSGTAPNLQFIWGGLPRVDTDVVAAEDNVADDGQVNPWACLAEFLLDERGGSKSKTDLLLSSWVAAAAWCNQDDAHRKATFISPLITQQMAIRDIVSAFVGHFNGFVYWLNGQLVAAIYQWGVDPGGLLTLDYRHWLDKPSIPLGDWTDVKTEIVTSFINRDYEYQSDTVIVPNSVAQQVRQEDDQGTLDYSKSITRSAQAFQITSEVNRRKATAPSTGTAPIRAAFVAGLTAGSKIRFNIEPEPTSAGQSQMVQVTKIERNMTDSVKLTFLTDNLLPATTYVTSPAPPTTTPDTSPPLVNFLGIPLLVSTWGWPPSVAILATRPDAKVTGFEVFFSTSDSTPFADLGQQALFSVRASLALEIGTGDTTLAFTELDGLDAPDASLAANTPGGNTTSAADNTLLAVLVELDGNGRVALASSGDPLMEFVSIIDRAADGSLPANTFNYTVLRGRMGTAVQDWPANTPVWIVPKTNILPWRQSLLSALLGQVAYFRLVSFTSRASDDSTPIPECTVNMPPATAPSIGQPPPGTTPDDGAVPNPVTGVTVSVGVEELILRWTNPNNVPISRIFIYESTGGSLPASPQFVVTAPQNFFFRTGLAEGSTENYWIQVEGANGRLNTPAGPFSGTVVTWPVVSGILDDLAGETTAREIADDGLGDSITEEATTRSSETGSLAAEYVLKVVTGGDSGERVAGFRITNLGGAGGSSDFILEADTVAIVNSDGDNQVAPFAVSGGVVFLNMAVIATASITDAMVNSLTADKITAGTVDALVELVAAKISSGGAVFNTDNDASTSPVVALQGQEDLTHYSTLGVDGTIVDLITFYGWDTGTGFVNNRYMKADTVFDMQANCDFLDIPSGSYASYEFVYSTDGGSTWMQVTGVEASVHSPETFKSASASLELSGLTSSGQVTFGIRAKAGEDASTLDYVQLTVKSFNL